MTFEETFETRHPGLEGKTHSMLLTGCGGRDFGKHLVVKYSDVDETQLDKKLVRKAIEEEFMEMDEKSSNPHVKRLFERLGL